MSDSQLVRDIVELSRRLAKFNEFYYSLIRASYIPLNLNIIPTDTIGVIQIDKAEWERWKKIKSIIDNFEISNG